MRNAQSFVLNVDDEWGHATQFRYQKPVSRKIISIEGLKCHRVASTDWFFGYKKWFTGHLPLRFPAVYCL